MPTGEGIGRVVATTIYTLVIVNGITENVPEASYVPDLIASMNVVAVEVASEVDFGSSNGSRRRLEVRVSLPTLIDGVVDAGGFTDTPEFVDGVFEFGGMCYAHADLDRFVPTVLLKCFSHQHNLYFFIAY
jgi:hypothetical protein